MSPISRSTPTIANTSRTFAFYEELFGWMIEPRGPMDFLRVHTTPGGIHGSLQKHRAAVSRSRGHGFQVHDCGRRHRSNRRGHRDTRQSAHHGAIRDRTSGDLRDVQGHGEEHEWLDASPTRVSSAPDFPTQPVCGRQFRRRGPSRYAHATWPLRLPETDRSNGLSDGASSSTAEHYRLSAQVGYGYQHVDDGIGRRRAAKPCP